MERDLCGDSRLVDFDIDREARILEGIIRAMENAHAFMRVDKPKLTRLRTRLSELKEPQTNSGE